MKKLLSLCLLLALCFTASAEYQVYRYMAHIKFPGKTSSGYTARSITLKGYLVTVCCYPCGSDYGTAYPSWLYVMRTNDKTKTLWKIPMRVAGGVYGPYLNATIVHEYYWEHWLNGSLIRYYANKATRSYVELYFVSTQLDKNGGNLLGGTQPRVTTTQAGMGAASVKINRQIEQWLNPYIKSASGSVVGNMDMDAFGYDPANFNLEDWTTVHGTFQMQFHSSLTELIRGTSDWNVIDRFMYSQFKYQNLVVEPVEEDFYWHWYD